MFELETERLRLRDMTVGDADNLLLILADPVAMQYYPSTLDLEGVRAWIARTLANYERYGHGFWIVESRADGRFLGQCGLLPQPLQDAVETEVAYLFARRNWGQGYATEAAQACRDWGFGHLGVPRLVSLISVYNLPSMRVAERNGMRRVSSMIKSGIPHHVYAISREEWHAARPPASP